MFYVIIFQHSYVLLSPGPTKPTILPIVYDRNRFNNHEHSELYRHCIYVIRKRIGNIL